MVWVACSVGSVFFRRIDRGVHLQVGNIGLGLDRDAARLILRGGDRRPDRRAKIDDRLLWIVGGGDQHRRARRGRQGGFGRGFGRRMGLGIGRRAAFGRRLGGLRLALAWSGGWRSGVARLRWRGCARWAILAGVWAASVGGAGGRMARSCGFCRITIATTATDSTIPKTTASAAHGQVRRFSTGAEGATGRTPSASGFGATPLNGASSAGAASSSSSSFCARLAMIGGASGASIGLVRSPGATAARLAEAGI